MVQNSQDVLFGRRAWRGMEPHAPAGDTAQPLQEITEICDVGERRATMAPT